MSSLDAEIFVQPAEMIKTLTRLTPEQARQAEARIAEIEHAMVVKISGSLLHSLADGAFRDSFRWWIASCTRTLLEIHVPTLRTLEELNECIAQIWPYIVCVTINQKWATRQVGDELKAGLELYLLRYDWSNTTSDVGAYSLGLVTRDTLLEQYHYAKMQLLGTDPHAEEKACARVGVTQDDMPGAPPLCSGAGQQHDREDSGSPGSPEIAELPGAAGVSGEISLVSDSPGRPGP